MRPHRIALALVAAALPACVMPAGAQENRPTPPGVGWLGVGYDLRWVQRDGACEVRVLVESVVEGAPADRAGLRPGDAILELDGRPLGGAGLELLPTRLRPGDPVRLRVLRPESGVREIVAVADRRPDRPPVVLRGSAPGPLAASGAPVVRIAGDSLVARNVDPSWRPERGYWVAHGDGRTEYRRAVRYRPSELDRRVVELAACVNGARDAAAPAAARSREVWRIHARADSLRQVLARRALSRRDPMPAPGRPGAGAVPLPDGPPDVHVFSFRIADHVLAGERGVAGAELTPLDPDLAEYFRGARRGLLVLRVAPGSPAARAGLRPGDVITRAAGREIDSVAALRQLLDAPPGAGSLEIRLVRHGRRQSVTLPKD